MLKSVCSSFWSCIRDQFIMHISSSLFTKFQVDEQVRSVASSLRTCKDRLAHSAGHVSYHCSWHAPATRCAPDPTSRRSGSRSMRCLRVVMRTRASELAACSRDKFVVGRTLWSVICFLPSSVATNVETLTCSVHCWISVCGFSGEHCCTQITTRCSPILFFCVLSRLSKRGFS